MDDPLILAAVAGALLVTTLAAALIPARRAISIEPVSAFRIEEVWRTEATEETGITRRSEDTEDERRRNRHVRRPRFPIGGCRPGRAVAREARSGQRLYLTETPFVFVAPCDPLLRILRIELLGRDIAVVAVWIVVNPVLIVGMQIPQAIR
jgi:hypothetical protein